MQADYVIVGAGSAGCVLANRLTEDPSVRVILIEAGGKDWNPLIHIPVGYNLRSLTRVAPSAVGRRGVIRPADEAVRQSRGFRGAF